MADMKRSLHLFEVFGHRFRKSTASNLFDEKGPFDRALLTNRLLFDQETLGMKSLCNARDANLARCEVPRIIKEAFGQACDNVNEVILRRGTVFFATNVAIRHVIKEIQFAKKSLGLGSHGVPNKLEKMQIKVHDGLEGLGIFASRTCQQTPFEFLSHRVCKRLECRASARIDFPSQIVNHREVHGK